MLVADLTHHRVDLLGAEQGAQDAQATADRRAQQCFREQLGKAGLAASCVREASLEYRRGSRAECVFVNGHAATGYELTLGVRVVTDLNRTYEGAVAIFVAPHDAARELRSTRPA